MIAVAGIEEMDRAALVAAWSAMFNTMPPKGMSQVFLRRFLAFEIQSRQLGGMRRSVVSQLTKARSSGIPERTKRMKPGWRLLR